MSCNDTEVSLSAVKYSEIELRFVLVLMMNALEQETGTKEAAWKALLKCHKTNMDNAPQEIREDMDALFRELVVHTFAP